MVLSAISTAGTRSKQTLSMRLVITSGFFKTCWPWSVLNCKPEKNWELWSTKIINARNRGKCIHKHDRNVNWTLKPSLKNTLLVNFVLTMLSVLLSCFLFRHCQFSFRIQWTKITINLTTTFDSPCASNDFKKTGADLLSANVVYGNI